VAAWFVTGFSCRLCPADLDDFDLFPSPDLSVWSIVLVVFSGLGLLEDFFILCDGASVFDGAVGTGDLDEDDAGGIDELETDLPPTVASSELFFLNAKEGLFGNGGGAGLGIES